MLILSMVQSTVLSVTMNTSLETNELEVETNSPNLSSALSKFHFKPIKGIINIETNPLNLAQYYKLKKGY